MNFSPSLLQGKTLLVTGAGKGIGKACVLLADAVGAKVIAVARTKNDLDALNKVCNGRLDTWAMDVNESTLQQRISALPELHGLINNAGTNRVGPMQEQSSDAIDAVINLNVKALYLVSQAALIPMARSQGAAIVNMSSQMGHVGSPGRTLYCMSKHAVEGLTKAMAVELAAQNIRVNSVAPTFVRTPMTEPMFADAGFTRMVMDSIPLQKLATPNDIANACVFLLSDLATMITGACLKVDGGWTAR